MPAGTSLPAKEWGGIPQAPLGAGGVGLSYTNFDWIRPGLAVGACPDAPSLLAGLFDAVVDLRPLPEPELPALYGDLGIAYRAFPLRDGHLPPGGVGALESLLAWIAARRAAEARVLVHCQGGSSRAPFVTACYLLRAEGGDADDVVRDIQRRRPPAALMAPTFRAVLRQLGGRAE